MPLSRANTELSELRPGTSLIWTRDVVPHTCPGQTMPATAPESPGGPSATRSPAAAPIMTPTPTGTRGRARHVHNRGSQGANQSPWRSLRPQEVRHLQLPAKRCPRRHPRPRASRWPSRHPGTAAPAAAKAAVRGLPRRHLRPHRLRLRRRAGAGAGPAPAPHPWPPSPCCCRTARRTSASKPSPKPSRPLSAARARSWSKSPAVLQGDARAVAVARSSLSTLRRAGLCRHSQGRRAPTRPSAATTSSSAGPAPSRSAPTRSRSTPCLTTART